ncbi:MAG: DNA polymerase III subunit gamma/tau [Deltaproteobacteria bacterium]|jgi:DNA polymerase III subunit gamma/tau|nr:DNA polymerase III subunit gamma/tau [Deltaproteobacteria bacterium]
MSYVVLARKLRPQRFSDLIGQEVIAQILQNAIRSNRVAHAFLFGGSRGVGKTSAARILTKALNCLEPDNVDPCNTCENCREISSNASADVYEIDAASNRGIENIRELRENVKYAPARCRYKVYIIDEAHMLTLESFNALLKTLEEPPSHVKFILATTDPHKVPVTILSRCQRYDFQRIPLPRMLEFLGQVAVQENLQLSPKSLELIARHAAGGMRDALTALDQVLSFAGEQASEAEVRQILGIADASMRFQLLGCLFRKQLGPAMQAFLELYQHGFDLQELLQELLQSVKTLSLYLALSGDLSFAEVAEDEQEQYRQLASLTTQGELQQMFHLLMQLEEQMKRSVHARVCFEMTLLQLASVQPLVGVKDMLQQIRTLRQEVDGRVDSPELEPAKTIDQSNQFQPTNSSTNSSFYASDTNIASPLPVVEEPSVSETPIESSEECASVAKTAIQRLKAQSGGIGLEQKKTPNFGTEPQQSLKPTEVREPKSSESWLKVGSEQWGEPQEPPLNWQEFVQFVQGCAPVICTLLRTALPVDLQADVWQLRFRHPPDLFSKEHQVKLEQLAQEFAGRSVHIQRDDQPTTEGTTLQEYDQWKNREMERQRENQACEDAQVKDILQVFAGSEVYDIELH